MSGFISYSSILVDCGLFPRKDTNDIKNRNSEWGKENSSLFTWVWTTLLCVLRVLNCFVIDSNMCVLCISTSSKSPGVFIHNYMCHVLLGIAAFHARHLPCAVVFTGLQKHGGLRTQEPEWLLLLLLCLGTLIATTHGNILRWMMRCSYWKIPRNHDCGCRCHVSDNVWAEAYFLFNTGMPTLAPTEPSFELHNERNKPSLRLGFEVLLKSLRFSPCGRLSAAPNKRGFVKSATEALVKLVGQAFLCWILGGLNPACNQPISPPISHCQTQRQTDYTRPQADIYGHSLFWDIVWIQYFTAYHYCCWLSPF